MKRFITLLLVAMMLLTTVAFAEPELIGNTYTSGLPVVKEKETFRVAISMDANSKNTMAEKYAVIQAEEQTNIHIEWIEIPASGWEEKVNIMLASNDLPDAFFGNVDVISNSEVFVPLDEYVETYGANIQEMFSVDTHLKSAVTAYDGKMYCLPTGRSDPANTVDVALWINTGWLEKLGLAVPTTIDEFYNVLVAFRDGDPNGNGIADEIPLGSMTGTVTGLEALLGVFGAMDYEEYVWQKEDGTVVFGASEDAYLKGLQWLNKLYTDKLIDAECFTMTNAEYTAKFQNKDMLYGCYFAWMNDSYDPRYSEGFVALMPLKASDDVKPLWPVAKAPAGNLTGFSITTACKNPAALVRYYDTAISTLENVMYWYNGPEFEGIWNRIDGDKWEETAEHIPEGANMNEFERTVAVGPMSPSYLWSKWSNVRIQEPRMLTKIAANNEYLEYGAARMVNGLWNPDAASEKELLFADIDNYMRQFKANAIVNGIDEAGWAKHLETLESLNVDQYVQLWQDFANQ